MLCKCVSGSCGGVTRPGSDALQDFQSGRIGRVIDYCLNDVRCTLNLHRYITRAGGLIDPRDGTSWLNVRVMA